MRYQNIQNLITFRNAPGLRPMTLYEFNALDVMEQSGAVWDSVHVSERDGGHNILLYQGIFTKN